MSNRIAIGTVQFGLSYGVANRTGQVSQYDAADILAAARAVGVDTLDTAVGYGQSETVLGQIGVTGWKVVTKLPSWNSSVPIARWVENEFNASLRRLGTDRLFGLMLHATSDLKASQGAEIFAALEALKASGAVYKIGYSIYSPHELDEFFVTYHPDIVQAPFNVFDQRLATSGWLRRLAEDGVEVHVRSAFLQGLLLMDAAARPAKFARWSERFENWDRWCGQQEGGRIQAALAVPLRHEQISRIVVGVDSLAHFKQVASAMRLVGSSPSLELACEDENLINPSQWNAL